MILGHPATLGLIAWLVVTVTLIALFAGQGVSAVWGISTSVVRGVRDWTRRPDLATDRTVSPRAVELPPLPSRGDRPAPRLPHPINAGAAARWRAPDAGAELEDLPEHPLD